jgi:AraC-like DNA-binding protein
MDLLVSIERGSGATARVIGTMTVAIVSPAAPLRTFLGVRFLPGEAFAFMDLPALCATDTDVLPADAGLGDLSSLTAALGCAPSFEWVGLLDRFLLARLSRARPPEHRLRRAVALIVASRGSIKVSGVAQEVGVSERQLERIFQERVGLSPKMFARVVRVQGVVAGLDAIPHAPSISWATLAASLRYADQAHLVREVKSLTGVTPQCLLRERMSGSFNTASELAITLATQEHGRVEPSPGEFDEPTP